MVLEVLVLESNQKCYGYHHANAATDPLPDSIKIVMFYGCWMRESLPDPHPGQSIRDPPHRLRCGDEWREALMHQLLSALAQSGITYGRRQAKTFRHRTTCLLHPLHSRLAPDDVGLKRALHAGR
jgi:hypothetical protein